MRDFIRNLGVMEMILIAVVVMVLLVAVVVVSTGGGNGGPRIDVTPTSPIPSINTDHEYEPVQPER